jgi:hypothetical protein
VDRGKTGVREWTEGGMGNVDENGDGEDDSWSGGGATTIAIACTTHASMRGVTRRRMTRATGAGEDDGGCTA